MLDYCAGNGKSVTLTDFAPYPNEHSTEFWHRYSCVIELEQIVGIMVDNYLMSQKAFGRVACTVRAAGRGNTQPFQTPCEP